MEGSNDGIIDGIVEFANTISMKTKAKTRVIKNILLKVWFLILYWYNLQKIFINTTTTVIINLFEYICISLENRKAENNSGPLQNY